MTHRVTHEAGLEATKKGKIPSDWAIDDGCTLVAAYSVFLIKQIVTPDPEQRFYAGNIDNPF